MPEGIPIRCPRCEADNPEGMKFCIECAAPRTKILLSKTALEGERKQVTVLFADLKGSMELLADRAPEEGGQF